MGDLRYLIRFFHVVPPVPSMMTGTFAVLTLAAAIAIVGDSHAAAGALVPVLLLQVFAASSGFTLPARRGHYDLLFTRANGRTSIALMHWASSIGTGIASWLVLAMLEFIVSAGTSGLDISLGTGRGTSALLGWHWLAASGRHDGNDLLEGCDGRLDRTLDAHRRTRVARLGFLRLSDGCHRSAPCRPPDHGRCSCVDSRRLRDGDLL